MKPTPEEMSVPGWEQRRNDAWYARRDEWVKAMEAAGYRVKLRKLNRRGRPEPGSLDALEEDNG